MAITAFTGWSATAASNVDLNSIPLSDSMLANQIDDAFREMMAQLASAGLVATSTGVGATLSPTTSDGAALGSTTKMWSDLFLASGAVINANNGDAVITHSSGVWTVSTGDLRVTTAGTNSASVVTVGGTQTLTNKTFTTPTLGAATATSINFGGSTLSAYQETNETAISQGSGITAGTGTFTSANGKRSYTRVGRSITVTWLVNIVTIGTASSSMILTLPVTAASTGEVWIGVGVESAGNNTITGKILEGGTTMVVSELPVGWMGSGISISITITYWA